MTSIVLDENSYEIPIRAGNRIEKIDEINSLKIEKNKFFLMDFFDFFDS